MKTNLRVVAVVLAAIVYPFIAGAQYSGGNLVSATGTVFADGGSPRLQDVVVRLCDSYGRAVQESATSSSGQFSFSGLQPGIYLLQFQAVGFQSAELRLDLSFSSQPGLSIYLKPSGANSGRSAAGASVSAHELSIPEGAMNLYRQGKKKLYNENDAQGALADFHKALQQAPDFYEARYQAGMGYVALGKLDEAEKDFRKCIDASHDKYGSANIALGTLQLDRGETEAGEKQIRHGLDLSPSAWMGYYQLGKLEAIRGNLDIAETFADQARQFAPATAIVYQLLANIHVNQKNYLAAMDDMDAYVWLDPNSAAGLRARELRAQLQKQMQESATR
ncbi:MAG TPA: carboxypeptidase regulatory-like domain-containing protein [Candidatus Acidoferrum sp.]